MDNNPIQTPPTVPVQPQNEPPKTSNLKGLLISLIILEVTTLLIGGYFGYQYFVECETQEEIDFFWEKLSSVPAAEQCGWCRDKFGITWQITPRILDELMRNPEKAEAVTKVFMPMKKLDLEAIRKAGE